jgi:hypothetical protein
MIHTLYLVAVLFAHYITPTVLLYVVAAVVSRFWHKDMWVVYLAMAMTAALIPLH